MQDNVTAVFDHPSAANDAVAALVEAGFAREAIHVLPAVDAALRRADRKRDPHVLERAVVDPRSGTPIEPLNGAAIGAVVGFCVGAAVAVLMATGNITIMGMGPAMRAGPFLAGVIGGLVLGFAGFVGGWTANAPLPKLEEPMTAPVLGLESMAHPHRGTPDTTIVHVVLEADRAAEARAVLERFKEHDNVSVWQRADGSWEPLRA